MPESPEIRKIQRLIVPEDYLEKIIQEAYEEEQHSDTQ